MKQDRDLFSVAWPYTLSMATGFIVQAVDSIMVAPMGAVTLAALGVVGATTFLPNAFTMGLITSVQKRVAANSSRQSVDQALSGGLILAILLAMPFCVIFFFFSHSIANLFTSGASAELASSYLRLFCFSFIFASASQAVNGYWIGALKSKTRLSITLVTTAVNVTGNLILTPRLGFMGVAMASTLAIACGFLMNLGMTMKLEGYRWNTPPMRNLIADLQVILGVSLHQSSLALTLNAAVFIVGLIGVDALAISSVIGTLSLPALYLGIGYGTATGSFLVKNFKERDYNAARTTAHRSLLQVFAVSFALACLVLLGSTAIRQFYFKSGTVYELSRMPILLLAVLCIVDGLCCALQRFHFVSDGLRRSFLIMTSIQWGLFIPGAWLAVHYFGLGYPGYLVLHLGQRTLIAGVLYWAWRRRTRPVNV